MSTELGFVTSSCDASSCSSVFHGKMPGDTSQKMQVFFELVEDVVDDVLLVVAVDIVGLAAAPKLETCSRIWTRFGEAGH